MILEGLAIKRVSSKQTTAPKQLLPTNETMKRHFSPTKPNRIATIVICILSLLACVSALGCSSAGKADNEAKEYVAKMYPGWTVQGVNSMDYDTNDDGYISSDVTIKNDTTGEIKALQLECAKKNLIGNSGCKQKAIPISGK